jgi:hypothetical protein
VPIVRNAANPGIVLVRMTVKPLVTGGLAETGEFAIVSGPDQLPLTIKNAQIVQEASGASAIALTFSQPMAQASAEDLQNYRINPSGRTVAPLSLQRATYDAATKTVTLVTKQPLNPARVYRVVIGAGQLWTPSGHTLNPNAGVLVDQAGNSLTWMNPPPQPAPANPKAPVQVGLPGNIINDFAASPTSFNVSGRSSGPPRLAEAMPPIPIHFSWKSANPLDL